MESFPRACVTYFDIQSNSKQRPKKHKQVYLVDRMLIQAQTCYNQTNIQMIEAIYRLTHWNNKIIIRY